MHLTAQHKLIAALAVLVFFYVTVDVSQVHLTPTGHQLWNKVESMMEGESE